MPGCCVKNCRNRSEDGFRHFKLPQGGRNKERRQKWIENIGRKDSMPDRAAVCEVHFTEDQFELHRADGLKKLKWNAVPTVFDNTSESQTKKPSKKRKSTESGESSVLQKSNGRTSRAAEDDNKESPVLEENAEVEELSVTPDVADMLCRVCGKKENNLLPIHSPGSVVTDFALLEKINLHLTLEVSSEDGMPQNICFKCHEALNSWHEVYVSCKAVDALLKKFFKYKENGTGQKVANAECKDAQHTGSARNRDLPRVVEKTSENTCKEGKAAEIDQNDESATADEEAEEGEEDELEEEEEEEEETKQDITFLQYSLILKTSHYRCRYCFVMFRDRQELKVHRIECENSSFLCDICGKVVPRRRTALLHQNSHDSEVTQRAQSLNYQCDTCGKLFHSRANLQGHKFTHGANVCEICSQVFRTRHLLLQHQLSHNIVPTFYCAPCCRIFNTAGSLKHHKLRDKAVHKKPFIDNVCDILSDVSGKETYLCKVCGAAFDTKLLLITHLNMPRNRKCPQCGMMFRNERAHFTHNLKCRSLECRFCAKVFKSKEGLCNHENKHTGHKPFKCNLCAESFCTFYQKRNHEEKHGIKSYACEFCGQIFFKHSRLYYHVQRHKGDKGVTYKCKVCDKMYASDKSLYRHIRKNHKKVTSG